MAYTGYSLLDNGRVKLCRDNGGSKVVTVEELRELHDNYDEDEDGREGWEVLCDAYYDAVGQ